MDLDDLVKNVNIMPPTGQEGTESKDENDQQLQYWESLSKEPARLL